MFPVNPTKEAALLQRMKALGLFESDIQEQFIRSSGPGGQNVNKTSTCVVLTHLPSGISVRCQRERSQALNRFIARRELCDRLEARTEAGILAEERQISKIRRQKAKRSKRAKSKMLQDKAQRGELKQTRRKNWSAD